MAGEGGDIDLTTRLDSLLPGIDPFGWPPAHRELGRLGRAIKKRWDGRRAGRLEVPPNAEQPDKAGKDGEGHQPSKGRPEDLRRRVGAAWIHAHPEIEIGEIISKHRDYPGNT